MDAAVATRDLTKRFGTFVAVDKVTFSVDRGEIFGILGPNGSGKTTTMRMLAGILQPSDGHALVLGIDVCSNPDLVKRQIGYMSQRFALYDELTAHESLDFFGSLYDMADHDRRCSIEDVLSLVQIQSESRKLVRNMSGGTKQRLALACALVHKPQLLLLDEPTAGVDPFLRRVFWDYFRSLVRKGVTILLNTHYMDEADQCDRLGLVHRGRIIAVGRPSELLKEMATSDDVGKQHHTLEDIFIRLVERADK
jgi:ABC-2 type transport system ATP-binding protein